MSIQSSNHFPADNIPNLKLQPKSITKSKTLRRGWTTGACATACVIASWNLYHGKKSTSVDITLGNKKITNFKIHSQSTIKKKAEVYYKSCVIKDAGDDPDVTHGCLVCAEISESLDSGIKFIAGEGVGTVTKKGLPLKIGEPAINDAPKRMIANNLFLHGWGAEYFKPKGWNIKLGIVNGEYLAKNTWNSRLGIKGGLSILGISGIVIPYSCSAWLASIKLGINVAIENGEKDLSAATGKISTTWLEGNNYNKLSIIDMGDFILGTCKQLKKKSKSSWNSLHIAGGPGKLVKCAQGSGDLHNLRSSCDFSQLKEYLKQQNRNAVIIDKVLNCNSMGQALEYAPELSFYIAKEARNQIIKWLGNEHKITVSVIDRQGKLLAQSN